MDNFYILHRFRYIDKTFLTLDLPQLIVLAAPDDNCTLVIGCKIVLKMSNIELLLQIKCANLLILHQLPNEMFSDSLSLNHLETNYFYNYDIDI